jgi:hypothetical protein
MKQRQRVLLTIDHLVVDEALDERALRAAIAAELGGTLAGERVTRRRQLGAVESAAARAIAQHVRGALPAGSLRSAAR